MIDKQCTPDQFSSIRTWYLASVSVISYQVLSHAEYSMPVSSVCVCVGGGGVNYNLPILYGGYIYTGVTGRISVGKVDDNVQSSRCNPPWLLNN